VLYQLSYTPTREASAVEGQPPARSSAKFGILPALPHDLL